MERYNRIIEHPVFMKYIKELAALEQDRRFCRHGIEHLLAVARIGYICILENHLDIDKDIMYGAALLHDLGRVVQYHGNGDHHTESAKLAEGILADCGYKAEEIAVIRQAIVNHGKETITAVENSAKKQAVQQKELLSQILYNADKKSRNCFICDAYDECRWNKNKKNRGIV